MSYLRRLLGVEVAAQVALASCAMLLSIVFIAATVSLRGLSEFATWEALAGVGFIALAVYLYSVIAVALLIAPAYALMEAMGQANAMTAVLGGLLPGLAFLLYRITPFAVFDGSGPFMELACMATGASVATAIHLVRTWRGANSRAA